MRSCLFAAIAAVTLTACARAPDSEPAAAAGFSLERYRQDVETLSADEFGGRAPSSPGEQKTLDYLVSQFKAAGLVGGNDGDFLQAVPLVAITAANMTPLTIAASGERLELALGSQAMAWTKRITDRIDVAASDLVFVGYGIHAPEYDWNDYAGIDMRGKTAIMLVNDPGFASADDALFNGRRMTYYGRWTYKYEEAARQGAAGVILIHETEAAGYPWAVVEGGWSGAQFDLERSDGNASRTQFESWITSEAATALFALVGEDFAALRARAARPGFAPVALEATASIAFDNTIERSTSYNVVAMLPGSEAPDETIAFSAHWDHLGTVPDADGDGIYNGAVDNATGTAALLELARVLASEPRRRSYLFLAVTAEESGLLGSALFAATPTVSLAKMVGLINIDAMSIIGPTRDVSVIGYGSSELENYLEAAASTQDRTLVPEPTPEKGFFYRSDHFNFAKRGVPVLYAKAGVDHVEHGREYGLAKAAEYTAERYHKPSDEIHDGWDFAGIQQDIELYLDVARALANSDDWPRWLAGNEFEAARAASAAERDEG